MSEFVRTKIIAGSLAIALGCAACTSGDTHETDQKQTSLADHRPANYAAPVKVTYLSNGMREVFIGDIDDKSKDYYFDNVLEWCENKDMFVQTDGFDGNGTVATSIAIRPNDPACSDGRLTPSDFKHNPSEQN